MKVKPQVVTLAILSFAGLTAGMLFSSSEVNYLFSRSVWNNGEIASTLPAEEVQKINDEITALKKQLIETTNDADKALEIRRQIQELKKQLSGESTSTG